MYFTRWHRGLGSACRLRLAGLRPEIVGNSNYSEHIL
jgi:hypothetical protein